jgi:uncharacterized protein
MALAKGSKQLVHAAYGGDVARVAALLEGPDPPLIDAKDDTLGCTALVGAAISGQREVVALLLRKGADVETRGFGKTALMHATADGHGDMVALLLDGGALIETKDSIGWTALIHAAAGGHGEVVALLLEWGALLEAKSHDGRTALKYAAAAGQREVVALLLDRGADASARDNGQGQTAEHWARTEEIKELLRVRRATTRGGARLAGPGRVHTVTVLMVVGGDEGRDEPGLVCWYRCHTNATSRSGSGESPVRRP